jgi:hypothetical protein
MDTSTHILVIILSVMLALFLLLSIIVAAQVVRLLRAINRFVQKAELVVENVEHVGRVFQNVSGGPLAIMRLVQNIVESVAHHNNKRGK